MSPAEVRVVLVDQRPEGYAERIRLALAFTSALSRLEASAAAQTRLDQAGDAVAMAMVAGLERMRDDLAELEAAHLDGLALGADRLAHVSDFLERVTARLATG